MNLKEVFFGGVELSTFSHAVQALAKASFQGSDNDFAERLAASGFPRRDPYYRRTIISSLVM